MIQRNSNWCPWCYRMWSNCDDKDSECAEYIAYINNEESLQTYSDETSYCLNADDWQEFQDQLKVSGGIDGILRRDIGKRGRNS